MIKTCKRCASEISDINEEIKSKINGDMVCHWCIIVEESEIDNLILEGEESEHILLSSMR